MKIFAVNGSPNAEKGMTHVLLQTFLEGAQEAGAETETVFLQKKKISYCLGCFDCWVKTPGECVHDDDMDELLEKVLEADYFVLGTPLYVDGMTAQTKTFLDRILPLADPHIELVDGHCRHPQRHGKAPPVVLVSVCGFYERDNFDGLVDHVTRMCRNMRTRFVGAVVRPDGYILSMDEQFPDAVNKIKDATRRAGRELVEEDSISSETLDEIALKCYSKDVFLEGSDNFWDRCIEMGKFVPPGKAFEE